MALCELNNIHYYTSEPCQRAAKTIKPLGTEDCTQIKTETTETIQNQNKGSGPARTEIQTTRGIHVYAAYLPTLLIFIATSVTAILYAAKYPGKAVYTIAVNGLLLFASYKVAQLSFNAIFNNYTHDTFGPMIIAALVAIPAFAGSFAVFNFIIRAIVKSSAKSDKH
jgi:hypothetical protein